MAELSDQTVSINITLIVVGLLATTLIVLASTWNRFAAIWESTPPQAKRQTFQISGVMVTPPALYYIAVLISLMISHDTWHYELPYVLFLMMAAISLPIYFYLFPRWVWRELRQAQLIAVRARLIRSTPPLGLPFVALIFLVFSRQIVRGFGRPRKRSRRAQPDLTKEVGTVSALGCFIFTIFLSLFITISAIPIAIGVDIGGRSMQDDFEFARAMIMVMPFTLACGLGYLGLSYFAELTQSTEDFKA